MKSMIFILFIIAFGFSFASWERCDSGMYGGPVYRIIKKNNILIATVSGVIRKSKIYTSADNGKNWVISHTGLGDFYTRDLAVSGDFVLAATDSGIYKSSDEGKTWFNSNCGFDKVFTLLINENMIFAGTMTSGLYKSTDYGETWRHVTKGLKGNFVRTLDLCGNLLYMGIDNNSNDTNGIFISSDYGETWTQKNGGIKMSSVNDFVILDSSVFVAVESLKYDRGVYFTTNEGSSWNKVDNGLESVKTIAVFNNILFIADYNKGLYVSKDKGTTWTKKDSGLTDINLQDLLFEDGFLYAGSSGGVFISSDFGESWQQGIKGFKNNCVYSLTSKDSILYAGMLGSGVFISTDYGNSWTQKNNGLKNTTVYRLNTCDENIYAGTLGNGIFASSDKANSWKQLYDENKIIDWSRFARVMDILCNENIIFVANLGLLISTDKGTNWENLHKDFFILQSISSLAKAGDFIYAGADSGIYVSSDNGMNWTIKTRLYKSKAFAVNSHGIFSATQTGIVYSSDNGESWIERNNGLVTKMIFSIYSYGDYLFVGTYLPGEIYLSKDNGENWNIIHQFDITNSNVLFSFAVSGNYLFAATTDDGVWRAPLSDFGIASVSEQAETQYLYSFKPYPIPASERVSMLVYWDTSLDMDTDDIAVYDIYGKKIAGRESITIDKQAEFKGIITWNCSAVPDGVYLLRITHGTLSQSVKVMVRR